MLLVLPSIAAYLAVAAYFHRRFVYNMIANSRYISGYGEIYTGAAVVAAFWPLTFWYAFAGPESRQTYALPPRAERQRRRAEAAEQRVRELERELGVPHA